MAPQVRLPALVCAFLIISAMAMAVQADRQAVRRLTAVIRNGCPVPIWPAPKSPEILKPGQTRTLNLTNSATDTQTVFPIWAKVGCADAAGGSCDSGECTYQTCPWNVPQGTPATIVSFLMSSGFLKADVALDQGYNVPVYVSLNGKTILSCDPQLSDCPPANIINKKGKAVGCAPSPDTKAFNALLKKRCQLALDGYTKPTLVENGVYNISFCSSS